MCESEFILALDTTFERNAPVDLTGIEQLILAGWWVLTRLIGTQQLTPHEAAAVMIETIVIALEEMESDAKIEGELLN